jgi:Ca-activated chloride channel family protein
LVPKETADRLYGNYTYTSAGPSLKILVPIMAGDAELRYMTGHDAKVLARTPVKIIAAKVTLSAAAEAVAESAITIEWTGPNNGGDYITVVAKSARDGQYGSYTDTKRGSPLAVTAPKETGDAELRYMSGQGAKVLGRYPIKIIGKQ